MRPFHNLVKIVLFLSLPLIFIFLLVARPASPFYALPLAPIALAAVLYEFAGGTLMAWTAMAGIAVLIALDPDAIRRATTLHEVWPILSLYLIVGPVVGWLASRERERERRLVSSARRLHVAQEIAQTISASLDLEQTLQSIIAEIRRLVPYEQAAVVLRENDALRVVAASANLRRSVQPVGRIFALAGSASGWVLEHRRAWIGNPADVSGHPDTRELCPPDGSCLIIPLQLQRSLIGVFILGGQALAELAGSDLDALTHIANQTAIAIEHARLYLSERERSRHMVAMSDACREIAASLDLKRTLKLVMDKAVETLPLDAGALFQFDTESGGYRVVVSHNLSPEHVERISFAFAEGVPGWVVKNRRSLIIPNAKLDDRVHPRAGRQSRNRNAALWKYRGQQRAGPGFDLHGQIAQL